LPIWIRDPARPRDAADGNRRAGCLALRSRLDVRRRDIPGARPRYGGRVGGWLRRHAQDFYLWRHHRGAEGHHRPHDAGPVRPLSQRDTTMNFAYTEEQRRLADSLRRLMQEEWNFAARRARAARPGLDMRAWNQLAGLGVLGLNVAAEHGGFGEPPASLLPVHLELGRGLVSEPVIPSAVMGASLIAACADGPVRRDWLPAVASGQAIVALAYQEPGRRYDTEPELCRVQPAADRILQLTGVKHLVWHGAAAHAWIVSARDIDDEPVLLRVPAGAQGVTVLDTPTLDRTRCARIAFDATPLDADAVLAQGQAARDALACALEWGTAALCAHAAGAMERLLEITIDYLKTRRQFGQPLAAFQVLQHRLADMLVAKEMALSMAYVAA